KSGRCRASGAGAATAAQPPRSAVSVGGVARRGRRWGVAGPGPVHPLVVDALELVTDLVDDAVERGPGVGGGRVGLHEVPGEMDVHLAPPRLPHTRRAARGELD